LRKKYEIALSIFHPDMSRPMQLRMPGCHSRATPRVLVLSN